jgi:hypothetical protein
MSGADRTDNVLTVLTQLDRREKWGFLVWMDESYFEEMTPPSERQHAVHPQV